MITVHQVQSRNVLGLVPSPSSGCTFDQRPSDWLVGGQMPLRGKESVGPIPCINAVVPKVPKPFPGCGGSAWPPVGRLAPFRGGVLCALWRGGQERRAAPPCPLAGGPAAAPFEAGRTRFDLHCGSPDYMAPEVVAVHLTGVRAG